MIDEILEQLFKFPVCHLDGQMRRVRHVLPPGASALAAVNGGSPVPLKAGARVLFQEGDVLTQEELASARKVDTDCWQIRSAQGHLRLLCLFSCVQETPCLITIEKGGRTSQHRRLVRTLRAPLEQAAEIPAAEAVSTLE